MTQESNTPSGDNLQTSGEQDNVVTDDASQEDKVSHSTYLKILGEKKKTSEKLKETQQRLDSLLAEKEAAEKARLEEQGNYKEINKNLEEEIKKLRTSISEREAAESEAIKFSAVLEGLGGKVHKKFYPLIDYESVILDPETRQPDELSVSKVVERITKEYPEIIQGQQNVRLPNGAPQVGGPKLTIEEWQKLPTKEMKARLPEVMGNLHTP